MACKLHPDVSGAPSVLITSVNASSSVKGLLNDIGSSTKPPVPAMAACVAFKGPCRWGAEVMHGPVSGSACKRMHVASDVVWGRASGCS